MANEILKRDENDVPVLAGITDDSSQQIRMLRVDPITYRLLVSGTGGGGGGYTIETPTGTLYNQTTGTDGLIWTVTHTPVYIVADGSTFFNNFGFTLSGLIVTMDNPVTQFIRSFY